MYMRHLPSTVLFEKPLWAVCPAMPGSHVGVLGPCDRKVRVCLALDGRDYPLDPDQKTSQGTNNLNMRDVAIVAQRV